MKFMVDDAFPPRRPDRSGTFSIPRVEPSPMTDGTEQCWLVERTFDDRNLVTLVYATPDGSRYQRRERSAASLDAGGPVTAAAEIPADELERVSDEETRERYATEAQRTASEYEPDDPI